MLWFIREDIYDMKYDEAFKYISCYGLSKELERKLNELDIFKYISCYGLSYVISILLHIIILVNTFKSLIFHTNLPSEYILF